LNNSAAASKRFAKDWTAPQLKMSIFWSMHRVVAHHDVLGKAVETKDLLQLKLDVILARIWARMRSLGVFRGGLFNFNVTSNSDRRVLWDRLQLMMRGLSIVVAIFVEGDYLNGVIEISAD
jgi:hypothetical protein